MMKKMKIHVRNITVALKTAKLCKCFILAAISFIRVFPLFVEKAPSVFAPSSSFSTELFLIALSGCWKATGRQVEPQAAGTGWSGEQRPFTFLTAQYPSSTFFDRLFSHSFPFSFFRFRFGLWRCVERVRGRPLLWPKLWSVSSPGVGNQLDFSSCFWWFAKFADDVLAAFLFASVISGFFNLAGQIVSAHLLRSVTSYLYRSHQWTGGR